MVFTAVIVAVVGVVLKLIAADPAGWFLVPLAAVAGVYHVVVHAAAARAPEPPVRLALISDVLLFAAILLQIDFGRGIAATRPTTPSSGGSAGPPNTPAR
jgi:hypothetical protein